MRLIDADALIEAMCDGCEGMDCNVCVGNIEECYFVHIIKEQPTISQWIPVSERLPDDGELVLLTFEGSEKVDMETAIYDVNYGFSINDKFVGYYEIIAWMPLPEPYKESDK